MRSVWVGGMWWIGNSWINNIFLEPRELNALSGIKGPFGSSLRAPPIVRQAKFCLDDFSPLLEIRANTTIYRREDFGGHPANDASLLGTWSTCFAGVHPLVAPVLRVAEGRRPLIALRLRWRNRCQHIRLTPRRRSVQATEPSSFRFPPSQQCPGGSTARHRHPYTYFSSDRSTSSLWRRPRHTVMTRSIVVLWPPSVMPNPETLER